MGICDRASSSLPSLCLIFPQDSKCISLCRNICFALLPRLNLHPQVFNPYLDTACYRRSRHAGSSVAGGDASEKRGGGGGVGANSYKFYDVDGDGSAPPNGSLLPGGTRSARSGGSRSGRTGASERFYEEVEYEKRVKKRRARLMAAVEEAFTHIKRMGDERSEF